MSRRGVSLLALSGILLIGFGGFIIWRLAQALTAPPQPIVNEAPALTEGVLVTTHDIPLGQLLSTADLELKEVPIELVPLTAMKTMEDVVGKFTRVPLAAGELILPHQLVDPTNILAQDIPLEIGEDQVLMAFPVVDLMSNLNLIKRGDLVDILVTISQEIENPRAGIQEEEETLEREFTFGAMQRVAITAVVYQVIDNPNRTAALPANETTENAQGTPQPVPTPVPQRVTPQALLIALDPQDALVLKHLKDTGAAFDIVLRNPNSTQFFDLTPVTSDYLIDKYGLEIVR